MLAVPSLLVSSRAAINVSLPALYLSFAFRSLDASVNPLEEIWHRSTFQGFEAARKKGTFIKQMYPCRSCVFRDTCRPCAASVIENRSVKKQQLCAALARSAEVYLPGFDEPGLSAAIRSMPRSRSLAWPTSCTMRSRASKLQVGLSLSHSSDLF
jgi:hypothetical protein